MSDATYRFALPNLYAAQAQKEVTHNEALLRIDGLLHCAVQSSLQTPPLVNAIDAGKMWLIDDVPSGEWAGRGKMIAYWTGTAWRYFSPQEGMEIWHGGNNSLLRYTDGIWRGALRPPAAVSGTVIDSEVRVQLEALISELAAIGLLQT
jgi:Protein of unknown function (DUF2793)